MLSIPNVRLAIPNVSRAAPRHGHIAGSSATTLPQSGAFGPRPNRMLRRAMPAIILPLTEALRDLPPRGVLLGLDLGTKTIGVAASAPDRRIAVTVEPIARKSFAADAARLL